MVIIYSRIALLYKKFLFNRPPFLGFQRIYSLVRFLIDC